MTKITKIFRILNMSIGTENSVYLSLEKLIEKLQKSKIFFF